MIKIQISNPELLQINEEEVMNLEDAIESIFPLETEYLILIWNNIFIPLSYKYDISIMILDFIKIYNFLNDNKIEKLEIHWASNTFASIWRMEKNNDYVRIKSEWKTVNGGTEDKLNKFSDITISKILLIEEIRKLMIFLKCSIKKSITNYKQIEDFEALESF